MGGDANTVHLVTADGVETWPTLAKDEVATPPDRPYRAAGADAKAG